MKSLRHHTPADHRHAGARDHHHAAGAPNHLAGHSGPSIRTLKQLLLVLCVAQLMVILDISAVNVALPDMARGLGIAGGDLGWTITSYSLMFGSLLLLGGRAADLLGRRRMFLTGLGVFVVASVAAATASGAATFFAARAAQGLGAAMLSPAALSILMSTFRHGPQRAHALAAWGAVGGAGAAIGVLVGGALTELIGWQAIFLVNVPIGLVVAVAARHLVAADDAAPRWSGLDLPGAALATMSLGALVFALSQSADVGWTSTQTLVGGGAGLAGLACFVVVELRTAHPLLRLERLADRGVGGGFAMMLAASTALFGTFLLVSLYLQNVLGTGALDTGLAFLPLALALALGVHAGSHALHHAGVRLPMAAGFLLAALGLLLLSSARIDGSYVTDVLPGMLVAGAGLGVVLVSVSVSVMTGAKDDETGMLSGLNTTGHEIGGSIGIAVLATVAAGTGAAGAPQALAHGIADAFTAASGIAVAAGVIALVVLPAASVFLPKLHLAPPVSVH